LDEAFDRHVPRPLQEELIRAIFSAYRAAHDKCCATLPEEETEEFLPYERWIQVRADLRRLADRTPEMRAEYHRFFTLIQVGPVHLTASSIPEPGEVARYALYRDAFTQRSQLDLFLDNTQVPADALMYVMLLHGADRKRPYEPLFAEIVFPTGNGLAYDHRISLFDRFPALVEALRAERLEPVEPAAPEAEIRLRPVVQEGLGA
jgi:hypothetical protein